MSAPSSAPYRIAQAEPRPVCLRHGRLERLPAEDGRRRSRHRTALEKLEDVILDIHYTART